MEGSKRVIKDSLRFRHIVIFCTLGLIATFFASFQSYGVVKREATTFIDEELSQMAAVVINYNLALPGRWEGPRHSHEMQFRSFFHKRKEPGSYALENNVIAPRDIDHRYDIIIAPLFGRPGDAIFIPPGVENGFYNIIVSDTRMRMIVATKNNGRRFVVARPLSAINHISSKAFITSLLQFIGISLLYIPIVIVSVNLMFRAIHKIARRIDKRKDDLSNIVTKDDGYIPTELDSFIGAINGLLERVDESVQNQRRFIADAAHEMRTPLTALSLQAEALEDEDLNESARQRLRSLRDGIMRERDLMTSLLTLAKTQGRGEAVVKSEVNIQDLYLKLVEDLGSIADDRGIDFGVEGRIDYTVEASYGDVLCVMKNLTSNALKYAKDGGKVDLLCTATDKEIVLSVRDDGEGIDEEHLSKVFEPFYRVKGDAESVIGTGLGLSIAYEAARRTDGIIVLKNHESGGLEASLHLKKSTAVKTDNS